MVSLGIADRRGHEGCRWAGAGRDEDVLLTGQQPRDRFRVQPRLLDHGGELGGEAGGILRCEDDGRFCLAAQVGLRLLDDVVDGLQLRGRVRAEVVIAFDAGAVIGVDCGSITDARDIADELSARRVRLSFSGSVYDPSDPMGKMVFNMVSVFAEFEADLIRARTREGMQIAKRNGRLRGKQPKLSATQQAHLLKLHETGDYTKSELADMFAVARSTIGRTLQRADTTA